MDARGFITCMICQLMPVHVVYNSQCSSFLTVQYSKEREGWEVNLACRPANSKYESRFKGRFTIMARFQTPTQVNGIEINK